MNNFSTVKNSNALTATENKKYDEHESLNYYWRMKRCLKLENDIMNLRATMEGIKECKDINERKMAFYEQHIDKFLLQLLEIEPEDMEKFMRGVHLY